jgi:O-antigen/teichoic acid export membrane protein
MTFTEPEAGDAAEAQAEEAAAAGVRGYSLKRIFRGAALYSVSDIFIKSLGFFLVPVYTRALTPSDYGIVGFCQATIQLVSPLIGFGLISSLPILYYAYNDEERRRLVSSIVNFVLLSGLAMTFVLMLFSEPIFDKVAGDVAFNPFILLALFITYVTALETIPLNLLNMQDKPGRYAIYASGLGLLGVGLNLLLVVALDLGAEGVLWASVVVGIVATISAGVVVRKLWRPVIDRMKLRETLKVALPALPHAFSGTFMRFADRLFLVGSASLAVTGVYTLAVSFSTIALMVLGGITTALNPLFYRRANEGDATLPHDWARLSSLFALAAAIVGLGLSLLGGDVIRLITPPEYHDAVNILPLLVLGQMLTAAYWIVSPPVGYRRKMWAYPASSFPGVAVTVLLNVLLVPQFEGTCAALAVIGSAAVQVGIFGFLSQRFYPIPYERRRLATLLVLTAAAFAAGWVVSDPIGLSIAVKSLAILTVPAVLMATGFFDPSEVARVRRLLRRPA